MINIELNFAQSIDSAQFVNTYIKGFRLEMRLKNDTIEFKHPDLTNIEKYNPRLVMMRYRRKCKSKREADDVLHKGWTVDTKFQHWISEATEEDFGFYNTPRNNSFRNEYQTNWADYKNAGANLNLKKINEYYEIEPFNRYSLLKSAIHNIYFDISSRKFVGSNKNSCSAMFGFAIRIDNPYRTIDERSVPYIFSSIYKIRAHSHENRIFTGLNFIG